MIIPDDEKSRASQMPEPSYYNSRSEAGYTQHPSNNYGGEAPPPYEGPSSSRSTPATTPAAGPSSEPSLLQRLKANAGATPAEILSNLPAGFTRAPPPNLPSIPFPPCALISLSHELDKGFPALPPPSMVQPHPFTLRDVNEEDWTRFLSDLKRAGTLSPMNHVVAGVAPLAMGVGLFGILVSRGIEKSMKRKKVGPVTEIIEHWNHYFFYPRQMEISLFQGDHLQSAPSRASSRTSSRHSSTSSSDSSSDSSDSEDHAAHGNKRERRDARRREKRERKAERKTEKRERKIERRREKALRREQRRDQKAVRNERWQLVVSYKPPTLMPPPPQSF